MEIVRHRLSLVPYVISFFYLINASPLISIFFFTFGWFADPFGLNDGLFVVFLPEDLFSNHEVFGTKLKKKACPICSRLISSTSNLRKHVHRAHGDPKYECTICGKTYRVTCDLKRHLTSAHRVRPNTDQPVMPFSALLGEDPT